MLLRSWRYSTNEVNCTNFAYRSDRSLGRLVGMGSGGARRSVALTGSLALLPDADLLLVHGGGGVRRRPRDLPRERAERQLLPQEAELHLLAPARHACLLRPKLLLELAGDLQAGRQGTFSNDHRSTVRSERGICYRDESIAWDRAESDSVPLCCQCLPPTKPNNVLFKAKALVT